MSTYNYYFYTLAPSVCVDPNNCVYAAPIVIMNASTVGTSTMFWHDAMLTATPLASLPAVSAVPMASFQVPGAGGMTLAQLEAALLPKVQQWANGMVQRLQAAQAAQAASSLIVPAGVIGACPVTY